MSAIRSLLYQPTHVLAVELTLAVLASFCLPIAACTDGSDRGLPPFPTAPQAPNYAGEWSGTTSESKTIQFLISSEQRITAISFGYGHDECSGQKSFAGLSVPIGVVVQGTLTAPVADYQSGTVDGPLTGVHFSFHSESSVFGQIDIARDPDCGNIAGSFTATKH